jgi:hypothetical protein
LEMPALRERFALHSFARLFRCPPANQKLLADFEVEQHLYYTPPTLEKAVRYPF